MNLSQEMDQRLEAWFAQNQRVMVALSGGTDSSLVAFLARHFLGKNNAIAVIATSPSLKLNDLLEARAFTQQFDIKLLEINSREMDDPDYVQNPANRCFFCKTALYEAMQQLIARRYPGFVPVNGTNYSDRSDYRPGLQAAENFGVKSPLADCQLTKEHIRSMALHYQLPNWKKPASPCLSSRFPYGETITEPKLRSVEQAENLLNDLGFREVRVRYRNHEAWIEVPHAQISDLKVHYPELAQKLKNIGFRNCIIDPEGLVSGKLNRALTHKKEA